MVLVFSYLLLHRPTAIFHTYNAFYKFEEKPQRYSQTPLYPALPFRRLTIPAGADGQLALCSIEDDPL